MHPTLDTVSSVGMLRCNRIFTSARECLPEIINITEDLRRCYVSAVTNFSSRRGIEKSSWGTKMFGAAAELSGGLLKLQLFVGCRTEANLCYNFNNFY